MKVLVYNAPPVRSLLRDIEMRLGQIAGDAVFAPAFDETTPPKYDIALFETETGSDDIAWFQNRYRQDVFARTLISDRFIARGYTTGGSVKPDPEIDARLAEKHARQNYVINLYRHLERRFDDEKPDVVFAYVVANSASLALYEVAKRRGVPYRMLTPTRIGARYLVDDTPFGTFSSARAILDSEEGGKPTDWALESARSYLEDLRTRAAQPEYYQQNLKIAYGKRAWKTVLESSYLATRETWLHARSQRPAHLRKRARAIERARIDLKSRADRRKWFPKGAKPSSPYVFFPLHVDPEASTLVLAPYHTDQLSIVEALSKALPIGMILAVKEHMPMLGKRPDGFYERITALPNVELISPELNGVELARDAGVVAVITGTAGWEAVCLGVPTVVIGRAHYGFFDAVTVEPSLHKLPAALERALPQDRIPDALLGRYVAAIFDGSFEMPSTFFMEDHYRAADPALKEAVTRSIADYIAKASQAS